jgi:hypothetical protein
MMRKKLAVVVLAALSVAGHAAVSQAAPILYDVTIDTTALIGAPGGPFSLNFQLIDGGGEVTNNATLGDFQFAGGGAVGSPTLAGGALGDLSSAVTLTDEGGSFFNSFTQDFDPGTLLRFTILLTMEIEPGGIPDQFSMGILRGGIGIPTEFFDAFMIIDINSSDPAIQSFGSDPISGLAIGAPSVTPVPEPASLTLVGTGLLLAFRRRRQKRPTFRRSAMSAQP